MDDVLKLMSQIVIDVQGFNENHFGIFPDKDQKHLLDLWNNQAFHNPNVFISLISPHHKQLIAKWASDRTSFSIKNLITILEKFIKFLKTIKPSFSTIAVTGTVTPKKLKGWRKVIYTQK
jgi:alpha-amylase/alpha-mannosidase (GH57 family)